MNKLVLSALAASVAIGTTNASEGDWAGLDAELNTLTSSLDNHGGPQLSGYIEAGRLSEGDFDGDPGTADSVSDWDTGRMGLSVSGSVGGYGYHMDIDGSGENDVAGGSDAFVTFEMGGIGWTMGTFRAPTTMNHLEDEEDMAFPNRSLLGGAGNRTSGLMASGNMDALGYWIHLGDDEDMTARISYDVMTGDGINLSVAASVQDNPDATPGAEDWSWHEVSVSSGPFSLDYTGGDIGSFLGASGFDGASCIEASYMINDNYSVSVRDTDYDVDGVDSLMDWCVNYHDGGARWTLASIENPIADADDAVLIGVIVGF